MTIARGPAQLYDVGSFSVPKGGGAPPVYRVVLAYDDAVADTCTCPAFFYSTTKAKESGCKHIGEARYQDSVASDDARDQGWAKPSLPPGVPTDAEREGGAVDRAFITGFNVAKDLARKGLL